MRAETAGPPAMCVYVHVCVPTHTIYVGVLGAITPESQSVFRGVYMGNIWIEPEVTEGVQIIDSMKGFSHSGGLSPGGRGEGGGTWDVAERQTLLVVLHLGFCFL